MSVHAKVDENGKLAIPYSVRKLLGLRPGARVEFLLDETSGTVTLVGAAPSAALDDGRFTDLARETQAQRLAAARGLAALRGGGYGSETEA